MLPVALYTEHAGPGRVPGRQRAPIWSLSDLPGLEARSELPEVQEFLRDAIRQGKIRVLPNPGLVLEGANHPDCPGRRAARPPSELSLAVAVDLRSSRQSGCAVNSGPTVAEGARIAKPHPHCRAFERRHLSLGHPDSPSSKQTR